MDICLIVLTAAWDLAGIVIRNELIAFWTKLAGVLAVAPIIPWVAVDGVDRTSSWPIALHGMWIWTPGKRKQEIPLLMTLRGPLAEFTD